MVEEEKKTILVAKEITNDPTSVSETDSETQLSKVRLDPINDEDGISMMMAHDNSKPTIMVLVLTVLTSFSGFMFGYDTGYISSALVAIGTDFGKELTYGQEQLITAATSLGALITAIFAGLFADIVGRKPVLMFSNVLFVAGAAIQCGAHTVWTMIGGRFVMGFGVGVGSLIAPLYISELAPSRFRGRLVILNCLGITGGQLIAYGIGAGLDPVHNGWRIVVGLSMIPPVTQLIAFCFLPETPRFLIMKGKTDEAAKIIARTHSDTSPQLIAIKVDEIRQMNQEVPGENPFVKTWNAIKEIHMVPSNFRALVIATGLQGIQQFTGFNSLMYFSSTIFKAVGFDNSTAVSIVVAGTNFIMTVLAFFIIDRVGRRRMLLVGIPGMLIFLVLNAIAFHFVDIKFQNNTAVVNSSVSAWGYVIIVAQIGFVATYAVGIGNVPWQQSELFPQSVRGVGASYATTVNWAGSLVIASTFLTMLEKMTPTGTFAFFAGLTAVAIVFVYFCYPELSNLELEETQKILTGGFNITASKKLAKKRKLQRSEAESKAKELSVSHEFIDRVD